MEGCEYMRSHCCNKGKTIQAGKSHWGDGESSTKQDFLLQRPPQNLGRGPLPEALELLWNSHTDGRCLHGNGCSKANTPSPGRSTTRRQWWAVLRPQRLSCARTDGMVLGQQRQHTDTAVSTCFLESLGFYSSQVVLCRS